MNNFATTESEIVEMGLRLAGTGNQVGLSEDQILGLAAAMSSVGINAEAGGSSMSRVMQKINTEVLSGGDNLEKFAKVSGMSADEFSKKWKEEPEQAIVSFVDGLGKIKESGGDVTTALKEMGINSMQELDTLLRLSGASDTLSEALGISAEAWEENTALLDEAEQRYATTEAKIAILKNNITDLAKTVGDELKSSLLGVIDTSIDMVDRLSTAFEEGGFSGLVEELGSALADVLTMLAEAAPQLMESATNMIMAFLTGIRKNLPQISEAAIEMIQSFIESALTILPEMLILGIELITNLMQGISEMIPELIPLAMSAIDNIFNSLMDSLPKILDAGVDIVLALVDGISDSLPKLMTIAIDLIIMVADKIIQNLPKIIDSGLKLLTALIKGIMDNLPKLIAEVPRIINSFADTIYSNLPKILKAGIGIMLEIIKGLIQSIPTLIANIPAIITAIVNAFLLYNWWQLGTNMMAKVRTGIGNMGPKLANIGKTVAEGVISAIKGLFRSALNIGKNMGSNLGSGISSMIGNLGSIASNLASSAMTAIKTAFSKAPSLGSDMVKGIWNGISNVTGWILSKIKGFGTSIVDGIKDIFKIKSPSRVMRDEVGVMIGRGLADGIDKSKDEVDSSANKMSKSVLKIMNDLNSSAKEITDAHNKEIARIHKRAKEDIELIEAKAAKSKRKLTAAERVRIQRITEDSLKKVVAIEEKAAKDREKIAKENSKLLLEMSDDFITEKKKKGELSLLDEVNYWDQLSKVVQSGSEEYKKALENKQNVINQISSEILKINEDYTQQMLDIDKRLIDETKKLNDEYSQAYSKRVNDLMGIGGLFDEFVAKDSVSGEQLIENLGTQIIALAQYEDYIANLGARIGNEDLMGELKDLGPKAVSEIKALLRLSDEQLDHYVSLYEAKFSLATTQAEKELRPMKENTEQQIKELNKAAQVELGILQSDWTKSIQKLVSGTEKELDSLKGVGANAIKGLEEGMLSMEDGLMATANRIANSIRSTIQSALQINSPSRLMRDEVGKNIIRGIGVGLEDEMPSLQRDINKEMSKLTHKMKSTVEFETSSSARAMTGSSGYSRGSETVTNNNDNGVVQNVTIVSPENTPSENARALRKVGRDLALGYQ